MCGVCEGWGVVGDGHGVVDGASGVDLEALGVSEGERRLLYVGTGSGRARGWVGEGAGPVASGGSGVS